MKRCTDCGKLFIPLVEHMKFMEFIRSEHPDDDRFVDYDTEPYGVPLCCSCAVETYDSVLYGDDDLTSNDPEEKLDISDLFWPDK